LSRARPSAPTPPARRPRVRTVLARRAGTSPPVGDLRPRCFR
jgi:hypothetical protein